MFTINDTVIITEGALKNAEGVIKKLGNKEYFVELSILGKKVTQWLVERSLVKKDNNLLNNWEQRNDDDMIIKDINGNTVAHIMYIDNNENYLAYVYKPKGNRDIPEYEHFETSTLAMWWCDEKLVHLGYKFKT